MSVVSLLLRPRSTAGCELRRLGLEPDRTRRLLHQPKLLAKLGAVGRPVHRHLRIRASYGPGLGVLSLSCQESARREYVNANAILMG